MPYCKARLDCNRFNPVECEEVGTYKCFEPRTPTSPSPCLATGYVWVPVKDSLPEKNQRVVVYTPNVDIENTYREMDGQFVPKMKDATHWLLLIEPTTI